MTTFAALLETGVYDTVAEIAAAEKVNGSYACRILRVALLAPDLEWRRPLPLAQYTGDRGSGQAPQGKRARKTALFAGAAGTWRRERDSNPRYSF